MKRNSLFILFLSLLWNSNISFAQSDSSIDSLLTAKMKEAGIVGMGATIILNKKLVWSNGYGFADKEKKIPFTTSTIMNIGSISKTFTGVCLMKAVEMGLLNLDEDINSYLPFKISNPNFPEERITLRQLSTHTSSLADRHPFYSEANYFSEGKQPEPLGEFLKNYFTATGKYYSKENFLNNTPGSYRDYSNIGAALAGYIVELKTGKKLPQFSRDIIFVPLGMKNTGWLLSEVDLSRHSKLYEKTDTSFNNIPLYEQTTYPDGGVRTSVKELSKFFISLLNDGKYGRAQLLKTETVQEMTRFQFTETSKPNNVKHTQLNSGIFWATKIGATRIGHNGSDPGVRTFMLSDLNKEIAVIVFFNTSLTEDKEGKYFEIYEELYKYGKILRSTHK
jgi:CubicO group peptidase (beta-lactamase class C family)